MPYTLSPYPFAKHPSSVSYEAAREYCARFVAGIPDRIEVLAEQTSLVSGAGIGCSISGVGGLRVSRMLS